MGEGGQRRRAGGSGSRRQRRQAAAGQQHAWAPRAPLTALESPAGGGGQPAGRHALLPRSKAMQHCGLRTWDAPVCLLLDAGRMQRVVNVLNVQKPPAAAGRSPKSVGCTGWLASGGFLHLRVANCRCSGGRKPACTLHGPRCSAGPLAFVQRSAPPAAVDHHYSQHRRAQRQGRTRGAIGGQRNGQGGRDREQSALPPAADVADQAPAVPQAPAHLVLRLPTPLTLLQRPLLP